MKKSIEFYINIPYLQEYKKSKKLTNRQLANKIGVHESTMSRILRCEKGIGMKFIVGVIHNASDLDLDKLLKVEKNKKTAVTN